MNLTLSVSYRCNSRCLTCNVWKKRVDDLTLDEYKALFAGLGSSLYWATFSGGEPFLRPDLIDIVIACYDRCRPAIINIPTNGLLRTPPTWARSLMRSARAAGARHNSTSPIHASRPSSV